MRKIVLALLVLLLAVPAMATVEVRCAQVSDTNQVIVTYDVTDGNEFRAFGIEISVDNGATLGSVIDVNDSDYYIYPGSIDVNATTGVVDNPGSAVVDKDANSFILEMGSLYADNDACHPNAPPTSGQLCSFYVDFDCNVSIIGNAARGKVVMADIEKTFASDYVDLVGCQVLAPPDCFTQTGPVYDQWVALGKPDCWCTNLRQCHGDYDGDDEGDPKQGYFYVWQSDLNLVVEGWMKTDAYLAANELNGINLACADGDRAKEGDPKQGYFSVWQSDLNLVVDNWMTNPDTNCPH